VKLYAISDLHLRFRVNREALAALPAHPDDWVILAGDVGESEQDLRTALEAFTARFARVFWVPGNHELWTTPSDPLTLRGESRYLHFVDVCRRYGVRTPEDPFETYPGEGGPCVIAPLFVLYDYSFRPADVPADGALAWAAEQGIVCSDESLLHPDPYPTRQAWCAARVAYCEARLAEIPAALPTVLVNHFPLRREMVVLPAIPRFSLWCGTTRTEDWHTRFRARVVVQGHLHVRFTSGRDGARFEEVSLGYPRQWRQERGMAAYLREVLPGAW
jgi:3',5'-cyclic AMP phosphodiesterase CpdA